MSRYQPGCDEDLSFQITRLKEESERRQALIEEETFHIEMILKDSIKKLKTCQGQQQGKKSQIFVRVFLRPPPLHNSLFTLLITFFFFIPFFDQRL